MNFQLMSSTSPDVKGGYEIIDINAPPISVDTWNQNIRNALLKSTYERLTKTIKLYTKNVSKFADLTNQKREVQECMLKHMQYFKSQALDLKECTEIEYYELLEDVLVTYCKLELDMISRKFKSHKQFVKRNECYLKAAKEKILKAVKMFLNNEEKHILHVLLKLKYNTKSEACRRIMSVIYQHVLFMDPKQSFSTESFCRNYIILMKLMELVPNVDHKHMESLLFKKFKLNASSLMTNKMLNFVLTLKSTSLVELINIKRDVVKRYFKAINKFAYNTVDSTNVNSDTIIMDKRVILITGDSDEDEDCQIGYIEETIKPIDIINLDDDDDVADQPNVPNNPECSTSTTSRKAPQRRRQKPLGDISASELNIGDSDKTKTMNVNKSDTKDNSTPSESLSKENFKSLMDNDDNKKDIKVSESQMQDRLSSISEDVEVMEVEPSNPNIVISNTPGKTIPQPETIDLIELDDSDDEMDLVEIEPSNTKELSKNVDESVVINESASTIDFNMNNDVPEENVMIVNETEVEKEMMEITDVSSYKISEEPHTDSLHSIADEDIVMESEIEQHETVMKLTVQTQVQIVHNNNKFSIDEPKVYSDESIPKETSNTENPTEEENPLENNVIVSNTTLEANELNNIVSMDIDKETPTEMETEDTSNLNEALSSELNEEISKINNLIPSEIEEVISQSDAICIEKVIESDEIINDKTEWNNSRVIENVIQSDEIDNHETEFNNTPVTENVSNNVNTELEDLPRAEFLEDVYQSEDQLLNAYTEENIEEELQKVLNLGDNIPVKINENRQHYPESTPESVIVMPKEKKDHRVNNNSVIDMQIVQAVEDNVDCRVENLRDNETLNNNILWNSEPNVQNESSINKDLSDIVITNVTTLCNKESDKEPQVDDINTDDTSNPDYPKYQYAYGQFTPPFDLSSDTESSSTVVEKESVETQTMSETERENELLMSEENDADDENVEIKAPVVNKPLDRKFAQKQTQSKRKVKGNSSEQLKNMNVLPPSAGPMHNVLASIQAEYLTCTESFYDEQYLEKTIHNEVDLPTTANEKFAKSKTKEVVDDQISSKIQSSPGILKTAKKRNTKKVSNDMYKEPNDLEEQWNFETPFTEASSSTAKKTKAGKKKQNGEMHDLPKVMNNHSKSNYDLSKVKFQLNAEVKEVIASPTRKKNGPANVEKRPAIYCYGVRQGDPLVFRNKPTIRLEIKSEKQLQFDSCMRKHYTKISNMKKIELGDCKPSRIPDTEGYLKTHPHPGRVDYSNLLSEQLHDSDDGDRFDSPPILITSSVNSPEKALNLTVPSKIEDQELHIEFSNSPKFLHDPKQLEQCLIERNEEVTDHSIANLLNNNKATFFSDNSNFYKNKVRDNSNESYSTSLIVQDENAKNENIKFHLDDSPRFDKDTIYRNDKNGKEYSETRYQEIAEYQKETYYESAVVSDRLKNYVSNFYPEADDVKEQIIVTTPVPNISIPNIAIPAIPIANIPIQNISVPPIPIPNIAVPAVSSSNMPPEQSGHLEHIFKSGEYMSESELIDDITKKYVIESHEVGIFMNHLKETRDQTLPFKKRRLSVTLTEIVPQIKEEISYPATPMISIAEVEADFKRDLFINDGMTLIQPANQVVYHANTSVNQYYSNFNSESIRYLPRGEVYHYNALMPVQPYPIPNCQELPANPLPQQPTPYEKPTKKVGRKRKNDSCIY